MHQFLLFYVVWHWMAALVPSAPWVDTYPQTARAIVDACDNDMRCAAVLTAIAYHESRFKADAVGDHGQSLGLFQVSKHWNPGDTPEEQARVAAQLVRRSFAVCRGKPLEERLGWYASGGLSCGRPESSRIRMGLAARLMH